MATLSPGDTLSLNNLRRAVGDDRGTSIRISSLSAAAGTNSGPIKLSEFAIDSVTGASVDTTGGRREHTWTATFGGAGSRFNRIEQETSNFSWGYSGPSSSSSTGGKNFSVEAPVVCNRDKPSCMNANLAAFADYFNDHAANYNSSFGSVGASQGRHGPVKVSVINNSVQNSAPNVVVNASPTPPAMPIGWANGLIQVSSDQYAWLFYKFWSGSAGSEADHGSAMVTPAVQSLTIPAVKSVSTSGPNHSGNYTHTFTPTSNADIGVVANVYKVSFIGFPNMSHGAQNPYTLGDWPCCYSTGDGVAYRASGRHFNVDHGDPIIPSEIVPTWNSGDQSLTYDSRNYGSDASC